MKPVFKSAEQRIFTCEDTLDIIDFVMSHGNEAILCWRPTPFGDMIFLGFFFFFCSLISGLWFVLFSSVKPFELAWGLPVLYLSSPRLTT